MDEARLRCGDDDTAGSAAAACSWGLNFGLTRAAGLTLPEPFERDGGLKRLPDRSLMMVGQIWIQDSG